MPNTKNKKFDWQIFLAVFCILLVICCSTICCVFSYTDKGVAHAEDVPVTNLTNLTFETSDNFYIKNLNGATTEEIESYINYFTNGIEGVLSADVDFSYTLEVGTYTLTYNTSSSLSGTLHFQVDQISSFGLITISCYINSGNSLRSMFDIMYAYTTGAEAVSFTTFQSTSSDDSKYTYYVPNLNSLDWFAVFGISVNSVNSIQFNFNYTTNLGCIISPNSIFATLPNLSGGGNTDEAYQEGYQVGYDEGYQQGLLDNDAYNQGYNDGVLVGSQFYKDMTYREDVYRNNESLPYESFERNILDLTTFLTDAFDINKRWYWSTDFSTTSIGGGVLYYPTGTKEQFDNIGDVLTFYKENGNSPIYCIYDAGGSALHKFSDFNYIIDGYDFSILLNDGYALGYQQGINAGNKATEEQLKFYEQLGFDRGKLQGEQIGYENGYSDARENYINNDYSFFGLISSVLDAPLQVIVGTDEKPGMLNFYIPGLDINIAPFLLSLFTVALVITVIRFILARVS